MLASATAVCEAWSGTGLLPGEWHDGSNNGNHLWASGTRPTASEMWADINDQPNGVCWTR